MKRTYVKIAILILLLLPISMLAYRYFGSIDWAKKHGTRIAALPVLSQTDDTGEFRLPIGDFEFLVRTAGLQNDGPGVVLLHGFPESSIMWGPLIDKAANEGFRVIAFDQRGYSPGARPNGVSNYHIDYLTKDVIDVADQIGFDTFHLVGHDWGAVVSWNLAMHVPERIQTLSALSIPHIGVFFEAVQHHPEQQKRSSYIKRLQAPFLPEYKFIANEQAFYKQMMGKNPSAYLAEYVALYGEYGAATATLNWYRALDIEEIVKNKVFANQITCPTLFIWGTEDGVIAPEIIPQQRSFIQGTYREISLPTGHSLIQTKPDTVIYEILKHFQVGMLEEATR